MNYAINRWQFALTTGLLIASATAGCGEAVDDAAQPTPGNEAHDTLEQSAKGASTSSWCDVKPLFEKSCNGCHDGKGTAGSPMGLTKPADFLAKAPLSTGKTVAQAVGARIHDSARPMPPRGLLPDSDLKRIDAWLAAGAPDTCTAEPTPPPKPSTTTADGLDWSKDCDAVYELRSHGATATSPFSVANGETHPQVTIDAPWGDEQVQAIGFRPISDNKAVLHHWILYGGGAFLVGWAPGDDVRPPYPADVGMDMPTGKGRLRLDMHYYNTTGSAAPDRSGVQVCVVKGAHMRKNHAAVTGSFISIGPVLAPANTKGHESTGTCQVSTTQPVHLMTAGPHAHRLAVHMKFTVKKKNGQQIVMHDQPFHFGEQGTYALTPEVILETGDVVTTTCTYDNPSNRNVTFGESTDSEMCFNFASYYPKGALSCAGGFGGLGGR